MAKEKYQKDRMAQKRTEKSPQESEGKRRAEDVTERERGVAERDRLLADAEALYLENLRLLDETRERATQLQTGAEVSSIASSVLSLDELLPLVVELIRDRFDFYYVGIFLLDVEEKHAVLQAGTGEAGRRMMQEGHKLEVGGESMIGWCLANTRARIALDVGEEAVRFDNPLLPETRSEMALPLISRGHVIGAMTIQSTQPAAFSQADITALQTMADQLANTIENARLFQERERRITELAVVNEIGQALSTALELDELLEMVYRQVSRLFDTTNFYIATYEEGSDEWTSAFHLEGGQRQPSARYSIEAGLTGHIIRNRQPILFRSMEENIVFNETHGISLIGELARSWLGVPLITADKLVGVMAIQNYERERLYEEQDLALFSTVAAQVAVALDNLRLLEETRRRAREMEVINEVGRTVTSVLDLDQVLRQIVDITKERFGHYFASIELVEGDQATLHYGSAIGDSDTRLMDMDVTIDLLRGPSLVAEAIRTGQPVLVDDVLSEPQYLAVAELPDTRSELVVPIEVKGRVIGTLDVQSDRPFAYDPTDVALLQSLASQAGVAIENARLFQERERRITELAVVNDIGQALSTALELDELMDTVYQQVSRLFDTTNFYIATYEEGSDKWTSVLHLEGGQRQPSTRYSIEAGLTGHIIRNRQPILIRSSEEHVAFNETHGVEVIGEMARSWLGVPLITADKLVGMMAIQNYEREYLYDEQDLALFSTIAAQVAVALDNLRLLEETQARAEQTQLLLSVSETTASTLESTEVMRRVARAAARALGADTAAAFVLDQMGTKLIPAAGYHVPAEELEMYQQTHIPVEGHLFIEEALNNQRTVSTSDTVSDPRYDEDLAQFIPARSALVTPMIVKGAVIGVLLAVWWEEAHHLTEEEQELVEGIVRQAAIAIESARLFGQTEQRLHELTMLSNVSQTLASAPLQPEEIGEIIVREFVEVMSAEEASVSILDPETDLLHVLTDLSATDASLQPEESEESYPLMDYPATRRVLKTQQPLVVQASNPDADPAELAYMQKYNVKTLAVIPLAVKGQAIGVVELETLSEERRYTPQELDLAVTLASQAAVALENARLFDEQQRSTSLLSMRVNELDCLNDIGRKINEAPPIAEFLQWVVERIPPVMQYPDLCQAAIEFEDRVYGTAEATKRPQQMVQSLHVAGAPAGRVYIAYTEARDFLDEESALLGDAARRVSGYIENRRLLRDTQARAEELAVLNEMARALTAMLDVDAVLENLYLHASRLFDTTNFYVALYKPELDEVSFPLAFERGERVPGLPRRAGGGGLTEYVISTREPLLLEEDIATRLAELDVEMIGAVAQSWLGVPMMIGDQVLGVIAVQSYTTPRLYGERHRDLLAAIASQAAIAIQNARLLEQAQTRAERERLVRSTTDRVRRSADREAIMRTALRELGQMLGASQSVVRLGTREQLLTDQTDRPDRQASAQHAPGD